MTDQNYFKIEQLIFNCEYIKKYCLNNKGELNSTLFKKCDQLLKSATFFNKIAYEFIYEEIPSNGFLTYLRLVQSYTDLIITQIKTKNRIDLNLIKLFKLIFFYSDWLLDTYNCLKKENSIDNFQVSTKNNQSFMKNEICLSSRLSYDVIHANVDVLPIVFSTYEAFWFTKDVQKIFKFVSFQVALAYNLPFSLTSIWSNESTGKNCLDSFLNATLDYPFNMWQLTEGWFIAKFVNNLVNRKIPVKSLTLNIPKQKRFRLDYKGNILDFEKMTKEEIDEYNNDEEEQKRQNSPGRRHRNHETIKCRYSVITCKEKIIESLERIKTKKENLSKSNRSGHYSVNILPENYINLNLNNSEDRLPENDILLLYIHGGAFFTQGSTSAEIYLRKIAFSLGGIPILAIDYSLTVPYPVPLQEILDVYLWALSGKEEVKEKLGFHPKKIVLSGDSCGGYFSICLTIVLNELNKIINKSENKDCKNSYSNDSINHSISLPIAIVGAYPALSVSNLSPAKTVLVLDPVLEIHLCMLGISFFGPYLLTNGDYKKIENSEEFQKIVTKNKDKPIDGGKVYDISNDDSKLWYNCDYKTYRDRADYIVTFYNHPFINPIVYKDKFEELKDVALYAFIGKDDFFTDEAIEMTRIWKGKKRLDIFDNIFHGFFQLNFLSSDTRYAFEVAIMRFQEACGLI